jgi:hypothetical protein
LLELIITSGYNLGPISQLIQQFLSTNKGFRVGDYKSLRSEITILLIRKYSRGWDYKEHCPGIFVLLYKSYYLENAYN